MLLLAMGTTLPLALCLSLAVAPKATSKSDAGTKPKSGAEVPTISLPSFEALPTGAEVQRPSAHPSETGPRFAEGVRYQVLAVQHAHAFVKGPNGTVAQGGELKIIPMNKGKPPATDRFSTLVHVKCSQRMGAPIELLVVDPRGDTVMRSSGQLAFAGASGEEVDYLVDWDSTPLRLGGEHQLLIRIAHQPMGTWPLNIEEPR